MLTVKLERHRALSVQRSASECSQFGTHRSFKFWPYLALVKLSWWYLKRSTSHRVDNTVHTHMIELLKTIAASLR